MVNRQGESRVYIQEVMVFQTTRLVMCILAIHTLQVL